jgi:hypothetical protein
LLGLTISLLTAVGSTDLLSTAHSAQDSVEAVAPLDQIAERALG